MAAPDTGTVRRNQRGVDGVQPLPQHGTGERTQKGIPGKTRLIVASGRRTP
jgi:hypothetical protein